MMHEAVLSLLEVLIIEYVEFSVLLYFFCWSDGNIKELDRCSFHPVIYHILNGKIMKLVAVEGSVGYVLFLMQKGMWLSAIKR